MAVPVSSREKFALIEWIGENLYSVVPLCCAKDPVSCKAGCFMKFKWSNPKNRKVGGKFYKALILKISGNLTEYMLLYANHYYYSMHSHVPF